MNILSLIALSIPLGFLGLIFLFIYAYVLVPLKNLSFYKNQGIKTFFFPVLGIVKPRLQDLKTKGDFLYEVKNSSKADPDQKLLATNMGKDVVLLLRDADYMKEFLQNPGNFHKGKIFNIYRLMLGKGLLFVEGDEWKNHRKIISSCFHYEFIKNNTKLVQETTREFLDKIPQEEYKKCRVMDKFQAITGEVVGRMFFGRNLSKYTFENGSLTSGLASIMVTLGELIVSPLYMLLNSKCFVLPIPRFQILQKRIKELRAVCAKIIQDRKQDGQRYNDLLDALLSRQGQNSEEGALSDEDIIDEFITFFAAGMDTTGHLVTMMVYNLIQNPEYFDKLKKERDETYNKSKENAADIVQTMDVLTCFLKETLRIHTPAPAIFLREAQKDCMIKDLKVKKGTVIRIDPFAAFFHAKHFNDPDRFNPERWQGGAQSKLNPFAFIPFSAGPRNCIGQHLALLEAKVIVCEFLERFECKVSEGYNLKMILRFLYEPYEDLTMDLTRVKGK